MNLSVNNCILLDYMLLPLGTMVYVASLQRPFHIKRALQNRRFRSFAEMSRGPDPKDPLTAHLIFQV